MREDGISGSIPPRIKIRGILETVMTRLRLFFFGLTILVVGTLGYFVSLYARGYRFDSRTFRFVSNGIIVVKSVPDGAQIFVNGELKNATNTTFPLGPGNYDLSIRKDGYISWNKRIGIDKEVVTEIDAYLFRSVPSLSALTFSGVVSPQASADFSKIAYAIPQTQDNQGNTKNGLWIIENVNLPLGFAQGPREITDGDFSTGASWQFSPDGRQILLATTKGTYLLDTGSFTAQSGRVNVAARSPQILASWAKDAQKRLSDKMRSLPQELTDILTRDATGIDFSPDDSKLLYTASASATIPDKLISPIPGSSTQKQERDIKQGRTYVYDIKEDRNFFVAESGANVFWFPSSKNLVLAEDAKITIMDYDGTNRQLVYTGSYIAPNAFPYASVDRLLILTNLGSDSTTSNLYSVSLR